MNSPAVGAVVSYHPAIDDGLATIDGAPLAAIVSAELSDGTLNLMVIDINGNPQSRTNVATADAGDGVAFVS